MDSEKTIYLFISSLRGGGSQRVCVLLANGFVERKFNVKLIVLNLTGILIQELSPEVNIINLHKKHTRGSLFAITKMLKRENPGTILVFNHQLAVQLVLIRYYLRSRFKIINRHISNLIETKANERLFWHKYLVHYWVRLLYRRVDGIISQSGGAVAEMVNYYRISIEKIYSINNPVSEKITRASLNLEERESKQMPKKILFVGRLVKIKGLDLLIEAFSGCLKKTKDVVLIICGDGPEKDHLIKLVQAKGIQDHVHFTGFIEDLRNVYQDSDLLVLTSRYEGFPNVLIEAITMGLPLVSFDCNYGPSEIIQEGINGFLVPQDNVQILEQKILSALNKRWDTARIQETSSRYSLTKIIDKYLEVYKAYSDV